MKKMPSILSKLFFGVSLVIFFPAIVAIYFNTPKLDLLGTRKLINCFIVFIFVAMCIYVKGLSLIIDKIKNETKFICILSIIYCGCLFLFSLYFMQGGHAETYWVYGAGRVLANKEDLRTSQGGYFMDVFSKYHYLKGILFVTSFFERIAIFLNIDCKIFLSFVNAVLISISLPSVFYVCKKIFNRKTAFYSITICLIFLPIYFSTCIFYNYVFIYSFPIAILALYVSLDGENGLKKGILIGFLSGIGFCVFNTCIIVTVALLIDIILLKKSNIKNALYISVFSLLFVSCFSILFSNEYEEKIFVEDLYERYKYPVLESTMYVGVNEMTLGLYSVEDRDYIDSFETYDDKKKELRKAIVARMKRMNTLEKIEFFINKTAVNFGNGTYYSEFVSNDNLVKPRKLIQFFSKDFDNVKYYRSFYGALNLLMLVGLCLSMAYGFKKEYRTLVPWISIFGVLLVTLISETNPRHVLAYVPFIIIIASYMVSIVEEKITKVNRIGK